MLIIVYLNIVPFQPRERDYAYVGSFYAFSIWIGIGVLSIYEFINKHLDTKKSALLSILISSLIPTIMAAENWDDHDRTGRFTALEVAKNYLNSCDKNAILFTNGDNDTFPLWYAQEVEGIRTDIKVVNLSLFNTDWYIDQMKRASYEAEPIPSSLEHKHYRAGTRDYTPISEKYTKPVPVKDLVSFIKSNNAKAKINTSAGLRNYSPARNVQLEVSKENVKGFVPQEYQDKILDKITWKLKGGGIFKNKLLVLDILAEFNWQRPIYFAITVGKDNFMGLEKYFQLEGLAYRLVPYEANSSDGQTGVVHTEKMYESLMYQFKWGGLNKEEVYFDETNTRMVMNFRNNYSRLAESLIKKGDEERAVKVLDKCMVEFPGEIVKFSYFSIPIIDLYFRLGQKEKGSSLLARMIDEYLIEYEYLRGFKRGSGVQDDISISAQVLSSLMSIVQIYKLEDNSFSYSENKGKYYREKEDKKEEIDYSIYRTNTFLEEYISLQN